jgi:hypothetical protein
LRLKIRLERAIDLPAADYRRSNDFFIRLETLTLDNKKEGVL